MENLKKKEYNDIPVLYCKKCLSLTIRGVGLELQNLVYCDKCTGTDIGEAHIEEWEQLYVNKYGHKYLDEF